MSRQPSRSKESGLVTKFLGAGAAAGGPFALLGLDASDTSDESVLLALRARLEQAGLHPEGATPEADEVRLALHAAAAQLLDARTREAMLSKWSDVSLRSTGARPRSQVVSERERNLMLLQHDAVLAIAACGGWNDRARSRLMMMAQSRGLGPDAVNVAVQRLEAGSPVAETTHLRSAVAAPVHAAPSAPEIGHVGPPSVRAGSARSRVPAAVLLAGVLVIAGILIVLTLVVVATSPRKAKNPAPTVGPGVAAVDGGPQTARDTSGQIFPTKPEVKVEQRTPSAAPATTDGQRWVQRLNAAISALSTDRDDALEEAVVLLRECAARWVTMESADLAVVQRCIVDAVYQADSSELAGRVIDAVEGEAAPAGSRAGVLRNVWRVGILSRLTRERDLPASVHESLDHRLARAIAGERPAGDPAFEAGVVAALVFEAGRIAPGGEWNEWSGWLAAVDALARSQPSTRTTLILVGLSEALGPIAKPGNARFVADAAASLAWHREPAAQRWLIARFDGLDTSREALVILTRALTSKSSVPGIDATMALGANAGEAERRQLRDRYAQSFGLSSVADASALDQALDEAISHLEETQAPTVTVEEAMLHAVAWSRISEGAWLRWRGVTERASITIESAKAAGIGASQAPSAARVGTLRRDEAPTWALSYLNAGSDIAARVLLLSQFPSSDVHPADAEIVLGEALRGSPAQVRDAARSAVDLRASQPAMVNAMLEAIVTAPRTLATADIIATLTGRPDIVVDHKEWRADARRALVERLLELMAARGDFAGVDAIERALAQSHAVRAAASPEAAVPSRSTTTPSLGASIAQERSAFRASAQDLTRPRTYPDTLSQIEGGAVARMRLASGVIQRTVAAQQEVARLMGLVIASEQPDRAGDVWAIVSDLNERLRRATSVGVQVRDCERAMALLWQIRIRTGETP